MPNQRIQRTEAADAQNVSSRVMDKPQPKRRRLPWALIVFVCIVLPLVLFTYVVNYGISLGRAAVRGDLQGVMRIVERNPKLVNSYPDRSTPLHYAAANGHLRVVKYLVENGADVRTSNENGITAEEWARQNGHVEVAEVCNLKEQPSHALDLVIHLELA